jgi:hypothetical protein
MIEIAATLVTLFLLALVAVGVLIVVLCRRLWQLMASVECLCANVDGLRRQIGHGGHDHAA